MKAAVIVFPGSNREGDMARALRQATGAEPAMLWHDDHELPAGTDLVVLPGGFSPMATICAAAPSPAAPRSWTRCAPTPRAAGWCWASATAFKFCARAGLLPGVLMRNASLPLRLQDAAFAGRARRHAPSPEAITPGPDHRSRHRPRRGQLRGRRRGDRAAGGRGPRRLPLLRRRGPGRRRRANPNGSRTHIAGCLTRRASMCSGLMPHPENLIDPLVGGIDGRALFEKNLAAA